MTPDEVALLSGFIHENCSVLEFGSGGSTQFFLAKGATLISIESDAVWLDKLLTNPRVAAYRKDGRWLPLWADIGRIAQWGRPVMQKPQMAWLFYHQSCWDYFRERNFHCVLVDGRFRVACMCQALLRCVTEGMHFAIHDFWDRPHYHVMLDFLDLVARKDTLGIFKPKAALDWRALSLVLQAHQFNPD